MDGIHHFDYRYMKGGDEGPDEDLEEGIPDAEDFFSIASPAPLMISMKNEFHSRKRNKDGRYYEKDLVEKAIKTIKELGKIHQFALFKFEAVMSIRKVSPFLDDISKLGLSENGDFNIMDNHNVERFQGNVG